MSTLSHIAINISLCTPWILGTIFQTECTPPAVQSAISSSPSQHSNYNITGWEHTACELLSSSPPPYTRNSISEELQPQCHIRTNSIGFFREYQEQYYRVAIHSLLCLGSCDTLCPFILGSVSRGECTPTAILKLKSCFPSLDIKNSITSRFTLPVELGLII